MAPATRPPLHILVTGHPDAALRARRTLNIAHGQRPDGSVLFADKHELRLRRDVHRGHHIACALLVAADGEHLDPLTRLAALHARREGVHRFVLLLERAAGRPADAVEREARELLWTLGVDGDTAPTVQSHLPGTKPSEAVVANMRALLAALDDLPPFLAPARLDETPPSLAREADVLDVVRPLLAPATRLEQTRTTLAETARLHDDGGGSSLYGAPYLDRDDPWPCCTRCHRPTGCVLQLDSRDVPHSPAAHGLFVVFGCPHCNVQQIRHHPGPSPERRRGDPPASERTANDPLLPPLALRPHRHMWQLPRPDVFAAEFPSLAERLHALGGASYLDIARTLGVDPATTPHYGGHQSAAANTLPLALGHCPTCRTHLVHVVEVELFHRRYSLWACREHPDAAEFRVHQTVDLPALDDGFFEFF